MLILLMLGVGTSAMMGQDFDKWNLISLFSVFIILCLAIVFCFQMWFKPRDNVHRLASNFAGESLLDD